MIEVEALAKSFETRGGTVRAVDGVGFAARDGEITGLLGPNGAGKTTTLRMLYTLMRPDAGRVLVDGLNAAEQPRDLPVVRRECDAVHGADHPSAGLEGLRERLDLDHRATLTAPSRRTRGTAGGQRAGRGSRRRGRARRPCR